MALIFMDGFDHYPIEDILKKWTIYNVGYGPSEITTGRTGNGIRMTREVYIGKTLPDQATYIVGFAFKNAGFSATATILSFNDGSTRHVILNLNYPTGTLSLLNGSGAVLATSTNTIAIGTWYYIEVKVTIADGTSGVYEVRVDGLPTGWIPQANGDTRNGADAHCNLILFGNLQVPVLNWCDGCWDDLYIADTAPGVLDTFIGNCKVDTLYPNDNGTHSQFVGQDADSTDNYQNANEVSLDSDTTYNKSATVNARDTYKFTNTIASGAIKGVQVNSIMRKDSAGSRTVSSTCISGETTDDAPAQGVGNTYYDYIKVYEHNPNGDAVWTKETLDAAEFGVKVVS
jgi:hypothetical protein